MSAGKGSVVRAWRFSREHAALFATVSVLIVVPCFWHRHIEAGDLPSHTYNAWLAQLIHDGKAPGLYLQWRWNNILFDLMLSAGGRQFGFVLGPKIAVAIATLVFFWGVFSFASALTGRTAWLVAPCIAMLAYGYTFHMGFFNYYLSIGLACFGLAVLWQPQKIDWIAAAIFLFLATLAHPIGALWLIAAFAYIAFRRKFNGNAGLVIPALVIASFSAFHYYLARVATFEVDWPNHPAWFFTGLDQFVIHNSRYRVFSIVIILTFVTSFIWGLVAHRRDSQSSSSMPSLGFACSSFLLLVELYLVSFVGVLLLPQDMRLDPDGAWIGLIVSRLTIVAAIFAICAVNCLRPHKALLVGGFIVAIPFFTALYRDGAVLNRIEQHAEALTAQLPYGTRVVPTLLPDPDSRIIFINHILDRACVGRCFTYSNYEPSSRQFRVRVLPGSPVATDSVADSQEMEGGEYVVQPEDLPLKNVYQCHPDDYTVLCIRDLAPGDRTGSARRFGIR